MDYTLFAIACYIVMRGVQVLLEEKVNHKWCKMLIKVVTVLMLYATLASLIVWYTPIRFLGFDPSK